MTLLMQAALSGTTVAQNDNGEAEDDTEWPICFS